MDLTKSPFAILNVTSRDDREAIVAQYDDLLGRGDLGENILLTAQKELLASKTRLEAELFWLLNISPSKAREIVNSLSSNKDAHHFLEQVDGLAKANLAAHFLSKGIHSEQAINALIKAYNEISKSALLDLINSNRSIYNFPAVTNELFEQALIKLRSAHLEAGLQYLTKNQQPGHAMTKLVKLALEQEGETKHFVDDLCEKFISWATPIFREIEDKIEIQIEEAKKQQDQKSIEAIIDSLKSWDDICQSRQLVFQAKGLEDSKSKEVWEKIRELSLWLVNEVDQHELALILTKSFLEVFAELRSILETSQEDISALENLINQAKAQKQIAPFEPLIEKANQNLEAINKEVLNGAFSANGKGVMGDLYRTFMEINAQIDPSQKGMPFLLIRNISHSLYEKEFLASANKLLLALNALNPPTEALELIRNDLKHLEKNDLNTQLLTALKSKNTGHATNLINRLLPLTDEEEEKQTLLNLKDQINNAVTSAPSLSTINGVGFKLYGGTDRDPTNNSVMMTYYFVVFFIPLFPIARYRVITDGNSFRFISKGKLRKFDKWHLAIFFIIILLFWLSTGLDSNKSSSYRSVESTSNVYSSKSTTSSPLDDGKEIKPPAIKGHTLTKGELRWCMFENERVEYIQSLFPHDDKPDSLQRFNAQYATNNLISKYEAVIDEYNNRCVDGKYYEQDMTAMKSELILKRTDLIMQAKARALLWNKRIKAR